MVLGGLVVNGRWRDSGEEYCIINVYAPCNLGEKVLIGSGGTTGRGKCLRYR